MRYLVVYAHPVDDSYVAALHRCVVTTLREAGHTVDDCDLNAEGFQPVLSEGERRAYHDVGANRATIEKDIERLLACEGLVFVFRPGGTGCPPF
jgi:NAD(P)H dehydrogenase (quinone)